MKNANVKNKRSKTYLVYLKSYLIVLVVPMLITIIGYLYSNKMIGEELREYQTTILSKTQGIGDTILSSHMLSKGVLLSNKQVKNLRETNDWSGELMFDVLALRDNLAGMANSNNIISDVQVFFPQSGNLITTKKRYAPELTYIYTREEGLPENYFDIIEKDKAKGYYALKPGTEDCKLFFYQNSFARNYKDIEVSVVTVLKWKDVENLFGSIGGSREGALFLIDDNDVIVGKSNTSLDLSGFTYDFWTDEDETVDLELGGRKYVCSFIPSQVLDLKYVICIPKNVYYRKNNLMLLVIVLELILCIGLGTSLAIYFARLSSHPLERILQRLGAGKAELKGGQQKIFDNLESALTDLMSDYHDMESQLRERNDLLHDRMLVSLLNDRKHADPISMEYKDTIRKSMKENWGDIPYRVIAFYFDSWQDSILAADGNVKDNNGLPLCFFAIENVVKETLLEDNQGWMVESDSMVVCIIKDDEELADKLNTCIGFFDEYFGLTVYAAVSLPHRDVDELPEAYGEIMDSVNFKSFWEDAVDDIIFYERTEDEAESDIGIYTENIKKISNCIAAGDYKSAKKVLNEMMEESFQKDIRNMKMNKCQASGIISLVLGMFGDVNKQENRELYTRLRLPQCLLEAQSINQLRQEINRIFEEIIAECEKKDSKAVPIKVIRTQEYIDKNYADVNLSIGAIAEEFGVSLSYIGRMFKKYTGSGILDYLHLVRVEKCKECLDRGETVKDAAVHSGFVDSKAMIRTFRKIEGITPGQYKKQMT